MVKNVENSGVTGLLERHNLALHPLFVHCTLGDWKVSPWSDPKGLTGEATETDNGAGRPLACIGP